MEKILRFEAPGHPIYWNRIFLENSSLHKIAGLCDWTKSRVSHDQMSFDRGATFGPVAQTGNPMHSRAVPKKKS
jgi:hypothetical protein